MTVQVYVDPMQTAVAASRAIVRQVEQNRVSMLITHGIFKILVGAGILIAGSQAFAYSPSYRFLNMPVLAVIYLFGGAGILAGIALHRAWLQLAGLVLVLVFDFSIAVGLGAAFAAWTGPRTGPALYPVFMYLHLSTVMAIHSLSILNARRTYRTPGGAARSVGGG